MKNVDKLRINVQNIILKILFNKYISIIFINSRILDQFPHFTALNQLIIFANNFTLQKILYQNTTSTKRKLNIRIIRWNAEAQLNLLHKLTLKLINYSWLFIANSNSRLTVKKQTFITNYHYAILIFCIISSNRILIKYVRLASYMLETIIFILKFDYLC